MLLHIKGSIYPASRPPLHSAPIVLHCVLGPAVEAAGVEVRDSMLPGAEKDCRTVYEPLRTLQTSTEYSCRDVDSGPGFLSLNPGSTVY